MKKILNLLSLFFTVISVCATALVCHILFIYPNFNNNSSLKDKNASPPNTAIVQMDNSVGTTSAYQNDYPPSEAETSDNSAANSPEAQTASLTESESNSNIPEEYRSALSKANDYSNIMYMSKTAIYDQLISDYGEKFTPAEAQYAIENTGADWNFNALQKAKDYQTTMNMSAEEIRNQLTSEYGERFTLEEANYAVANIVDVTNNTLNNVTSSESIQTITRTSQSANEVPSSSYGNETNFNTYDNADQQQTTDTFVLNTSSMKIHYPNCNDVKKIAPQNYSTSNLSLTELINQGYSTCGHCF